jgi:hypothetical protein
MFKTANCLNFFNSNHGEIVLTIINTTFVIYILKLAILASTYLGPK